MNKARKTGQRVLTGFLAMCVVFSQSVIPAEAAGVSSVNMVGVVDYTAAREVHRILNEERQKANLPPLPMDAKLTEAAIQRAAEITISYDHKRPNNTGFETAFTWNVAAGENIAVGYVNAEKVMKSWMDSQGHNANIMGTGKHSGSYKKVGIGCVVHRGKKHWAQVFSGGTAVEAVIETGTETKTFQIDIAEKYLFPFSDTIDAIELEMGESREVYIFNKDQEFIGDDRFGITLLEPSSNFGFKSSDVGIALYENGKIISKGKAGLATVEVYLQGNPQKPVKFNITVNPPEAPGQILELTPKPTPTPESTTESTKTSTPKPTQAPTSKPAKTSTPKPTQASTPKPAKTSKTLSKTSSKVNVFRDVSSSDWYYEKVLYCANRGLVLGTSSNTFSPHQGMSRGQFITILGRLENLKTSNYKGTAGFKDVKNGDFYRPYIVWAKKSGIVGGRSSEAFAPNDILKREEMSAIIARYLRYKKIQLKKDKGTAKEFNDAGEIASFAKADVKMLKEAGVILGDSSGYFNPKKTLTRAEGVTIFAKLHGILQK